MADMPLIRLEKITKKYGHVVALNNISFELGEGDFLSVFGPNGAGKSTFLRVLSTQTRPSKGELSFNGTPLSKLGDDFRKHFGVISHQPFLYENLSAYENLKFYGKLYGVPSLDERIHELMSQVEMDTRMKDPVRTYSRGMLQRTSIARALMHDPDIILLDEPYTGLDQHASNLLTNILTSLFGRKKTIILVTHNLPLGFSLASKVAILKKGCFIYYAEKSECKADFESVYMEKVAG